MAAVVDKVESVVVTATSTTLPAPVMQVSREDCLAAENLHLRVLLAAQEEAAVQQQIASLVQRRADIALRRQTLNGQLEQMSAAFSKKYSIDMSAHEIDLSSGAIRPRAQESGFAKLIEAIGQGPR